MKAVELKKQEEPCAGVIVIRDVGHGKVRASLVYEPALSEEHELTPAQAITGYIFGIVSKEIDKLTKKEMDASELATVENTQALYEKTITDEIMNPKPVRMSVTPEQRFQIPKILPGEIDDMNELKDGKRKYSGKIV